MSKKFEPTDEQRKIVGKLASFGSPQNRICELIENPETGEPIDDKTLRLNFRAELSRGMTDRLEEVAGAVFRNATLPTEKNPYGHFGAQAFILKTQAGWKETSVVETVAVPHEDALDQLENLDNESGGDTAS